MVTTLSGVYEDYYMRVTEYVNSALFVRQDKTAAPITALFDHLGQLQRDGADIELNLGAAKTVAKGIVKEAQMGIGAKIVIAFIAFYGGFLVMLFLQSLESSLYQPLQYIWQSLVLILGTVATLMWNQARVFKRRKPQSNEFWATFFLLLIIKRFSEFLPKIGEVYLPAWVIIEQAVIGVILAFVLMYIMAPRRAFVPPLVFATLYAGVIVIANQFAPVHVFMGRSEIATLLVIGLFVIPGLLYWWMLKKGSADDNN